MRTRCLSDVPSASFLAAARWGVLVAMLFAPVARSEPPMPNPLGPSETTEFPQAAPEKPEPPRRVPRGAIIAVGLGTVAFGVFAAVMTGILAGEPQMQMPSERARTELLLTSAAWIGTGLLAVATFLLWTAR